MRAALNTSRRARELRRHLSLPEVVLWQALRGKRFGSLRFRRQHPIGPYILDFYCPATALAIEVDGLVHDVAVQIRHDELRQTWLERRGIRVLRVRASDVLHDNGLEAVLLAIEAAATVTPSVALRAPPPPQSRGGSR